MASKKENRYSSLVGYVFEHGFKKGKTEFSFTRDQFVAAAKKLRITLPKNIGDVLYSFRYRCPLPEGVLKTQPEGHEWVILGAGKAVYQFKLVKKSRILPSPNLMSVKIPDATPEIISEYALGDEQALLAKVRYNRLIDIFLGATAYSLQNHLRTTVKGIGQIEIDEVYVAVDKHGRQFIVPVQAKGGRDQHGIVQTAQDIAWCQTNLPELICRPISVQFVTSTKIAMFALAICDGEIKVAEERHYELVPAKSVTEEDLKNYSVVAMSESQTLP